MLHYIHYYICTHIIVDMKDLSTCEAEEAASRGGKWHKTLRMIITFCGILTLLALVPDSRLPKLGDWLPPRASLPKLATQKKKSALRVALRCWRILWYAAAKGSPHFFLVLDTSPSRVPPFFSFRGPAVRRSAWSTPTRCSSNRFVICFCEIVISSTTYLHLYIRIAVQIDVIWLGD
jgi:hypothetical protein